MYYKKILAAALTVSCIGGIVPANSVQAASLKIRYSGKTRYYKGKQLHVSYANKNLSSKYVGIQINKVNMIPYYDYLVKQGPKVKRTYSKSSGKVLLQKGSISHSLSFLQIQQHRSKHNQVVLCSIQITIRVYQLM